MIILKLTGGLGNQLFQYALARHLSIKNNDTILFDTMFYQYVKNRHYVLGQFYTQGRPAQILDFPLFFASTLPVIGNFYESVYHRVFKTTIKHITETKYYSYDKSIVELKGNIYLDGFWQHRHYFEKILPILYEDFRFKIIPSSELTKLEKKTNSPSSVSVHVRRGDYTKLSSFGTCSLAYYQKAVKKIESTVKKPKFYIFSDDIQWAQENLTFIPNAYFVKNLQGEMEDLYAIASCTHHIIANSTFSWWGSVIGKVKKSITIAPTPWVNHEQKETVGLYDKSWILLPRD